MMEHILALLEWTNQTNEITSDSEDYKIIKNALSLIAYHYGVEAGRKAARNSL